MRNPVMLLMACLLVGCVAGPPYANTRTQDAATLVGTDKSEGAGMPVLIDTIDGATAQNPPFYLTPGSHHLSLHIENPRMNEEGLSGGRADEQQMEMDVFVAANGSYRLTGFVADSGSFYVVQLIDVASGSVCSQSRSRIVASGYKPPPE
jgi:hypothetical protein